MAVPGAILGFGGVTSIEDSVGGGTGGPFSPLHAESISARINTQIIINASIHGRVLTFIWI